MVVLATLGVIGVLLVVAFRVLYAFFRRDLPEWQHPQVGDEVMLHPEVALGLAALEPGRSLVLRGGVPMGRTPPP